MRAGTGPTHPAPSGPTQPPPPGRGHLPIGAYPTPRLGELVRDAERYLAQADHVLTRQYDPESAGVHVAAVDANLGWAVEHLRRALACLVNLAQLDLPPAGSAVMFDAAAAREYGSHTPARRDLAEQSARAVATSGGPVDHPGQGTVSSHEHAPVAASLRTAPGRTRPHGSECSDPLPGQGASHPVTTGEGRTPGLVGAVNRAAPDESPGGPASSGAGASLPPNPRRHAERAARAIIERTGRDIRC